jgi:hypothetical protein
MFGEENKLDFNNVSHRLLVYNPRPLLEVPGFPKLRSFAQELVNLGVPQGATKRIRWSSKPWKYTEP